MADARENVELPENLNQMNLNSEALEMQQLFTLAAKHNMYVGPSSSDKKRDNKVSDKESKKE